MVVRKRLVLPDGYRAQQIEGLWYLYDPQGVLLMGPADAATVEAHAWRSVWHRLEADLHGELAAFRAGTRPLHDLRRVRQYFRMVDAVEESVHRPTGAGPGRWRVSTVAAAAVAAAVVVGLLAIGGGSVGPASLPSTRRAVQAAARLAQRAGSAETPAVPGARRSTPGPSVPAPPPRRPAATYAVRVGTFASPAAADRLKHLVGRKGYVVQVVPRGAGVQVVTPPLATRAQAEGVVRGLAAIGLPAQLTAWRSPQ